MRLWWILGPSEARPSTCYCPLIVPRLVFDVCFRAFNSDRKEGRGPNALYDTLPVPDHPTSVGCHDEISPGDASSRTELQGWNESASVANDAGVRYQSLKQSNQNTDLMSTTHSPNELYHKRPAKRVWDADSASVLSVTDSFSQKPEIFFQLLFENIDRKWNHLLFVFLLIS